MKRHATIRQWLVAAIRALVLVIAVLGGSTCLGYLLHIPWLATWGIDVPLGMALNTGVALVTIAASLAALLELIIDGRGGTDA